MWAEGPAEPFWKGGGDVLERSGTGKPRGAEGPVDTRGAGVTSHNPLQGEIRFRKGGVVPVLLRGPSRSVGAVHPPCSPAPPRPARPQGSG